MVVTLYGSPTGPRTGPAQQIGPQHHRHRAYIHTYTHQRQTHTHALNTHYSTRSQPSCCRHRAALRSSDGLPAWQLAIFVVVRQEARGDVLRAAQLTTRVSECAALQAKVTLVACLPLAS